MKHETRSAECRPGFARGLEGAVKRYVETINIHILLLITKSAGTGGKVLHRYTDSGKVKLILKYKLNQKSYATKYINQGD